MTDKIVRSKRLRKKMHLGEFAILGFEFSYTINVDSVEEYQAFFDSFVNVVGERNLFISLNTCSGKFAGIVSSGDRYGNASEEDRSAIAAALESSKIVSDITVGELVDAAYI